MEERTVLADKNTMKKGKRN